MSSSSQISERGSDGRLRLPGFGLDIDFVPPNSTPFLHPLSDNPFISDGLKLREIRMMDFINLITDCPDWQNKVHNDYEILQMLESARSIHFQGLDGDIFFSDRMLKDCVDELQEKASLLQETGIVNVLDAELAVAKSDTIVSPMLASSLRTHARALESVAVHFEDWAAGFNGTLRNLLDPSLFPVIYGTTRVLPYGRVPLEDCCSYIGQGEKIGLFDRTRVRRPGSTGTYQLLPSDIQWTPNGPKITSYINNLHPSQHRGLYNVLEQFVAAAVPLWEECLFRGPDRRRARIVTCPSGNSDFFLSGDSDPVVYNRYHGQYMDYDWWVDNRILRWPEPTIPRVSRLRPQDVKPNLKHSFPGGLQISFKLFNVHLTPENPVYTGGSWGIEGALNDHIVATALFYYDVENISESIINFSHVFDADSLFGQSAWVPVAHPVYHPNGLSMQVEEDYDSTLRWYGMQTGSRIQIIGNVSMRSGRLLAYPNAFPHNPGSFKLEEQTKPGHLKALAMYLVDPNIRVLSTSVVPPQRRDWWCVEIHRIWPSLRPYLPPEIICMIMNAVENYQSSLLDFPLSLRTGRIARQQLLFEQSQVYINFVDTTGVINLPYNPPPNTPSTVAVQQPTPEPEPTYASILTPGSISDP